MVLCDGSHLPSVNERLKLQLLELQSYLRRVKQIQFQSADRISKLFLKTCVFLVCVSVGMLWPKQQFTVFCIMLSSLASCMLPFFKKIELSQKDLDDAERHVFVYSKHMIE